MDSEVQNAIIVSKGKNKWIFPERNGLYSFIPEVDEVIPEVDEVIPTFCGVQTVQKNIEGFTAAQLRRANKAISGFHMSQCPDLHTFGLSLRAGTAWKNCPINEEDVALATKAYGPQGPGSVSKGKQTRPTPKRLVTDIIEIPKEIIDSNRVVDVCIDLMFINQVVGLTAIDLSYHARHYVPIHKQKTKDLYTAIDVVCRRYNAAGVTIRIIHCDQQFKPLMNLVKDEMDVQMNYSNPGEHQPHAERNNRFLKERIRVHHHRMPYKAIPKKMTHKLCEYIATRTNWHPAKGGVSQYYSPHVILTHKTVNWTHACVAEFVSFVWFWTRNK